MPWIRARARPIDKAEAESAWRLSGRRKAHPSRPLDSRQVSDYTPDTAEERYEAFFIALTVIVFSPSFSATSPVASTVAAIIGMSFSFLLAV